MQELTQRAEEMMGSKRFASAAYYYGQAAAADPNDPDLPRLVRLAESHFSCDDVAGSDVLHKPNEHVALRVCVGAVALALPCLVSLAWAYGPTEDGVQFTVRGRTLHIRSEYEGAANSNELAKTITAVRSEGRDLQGWTGGSVWPAAQLLSRVLVAVAANDVADKRVLELGTGCGMPGLVAGSLGAREVWLTDHATVMAKANLEANFEPQERQRRFRVHQLSWGNPAHIASAMPPFDLLLGADISYKIEDFATLAHTISMLSHVGTVVWWASADGNCNDPTAVSAPFWAQLHASGFLLTDMTDTDEATRAFNSWGSVMSWELKPIERLANYLVRDRRYFLGTQIISVTRMVKTG